MINVIVLGLALGSVYGLFAVGLSLVWGVLNLLNLAYGALFTMSAYIAYLVASHTTLPLVVIILVGIAVGALGSLFIEIAVFRQLRRKTPSLAELELALMVASVGLAAIPVTIVQQNTQNITQAMPQRLARPTVFHPASWLSFSSLQLLMFVLTLVICAVVALVVRRTQYGRAIRALAVDSDTAQLLGVNSRFLSSVTMAISGGLAGLAGVLLAIYLNAITADLGDSLMLKAFAAIIIGGIGSIGGAILGGFLLAIAEALTVTYGPPAYQGSIAFLLIIVFLLLRPNGLFAQARGTRS